MIRTTNTHPPSAVIPLHAWVLIREDPDPAVTPGGLVIPGNSEYQGRRMSKGTVIASGPGRDKAGRLWEMPAVGARICFPVLAHNPDTTRRTMDLILDEDDPEARYYLLHASDALIELVPSHPGEPEPLVE